MGSNKTLAKVFFDAYELAPGAGKSMGIYNYAKNLFRALLELPSDGIEFVVACNGACVADFSLTHSRVSVRVLSDEAPGTIARQSWLRVGAALTFRQEKADIYFSPKGFLPNGIQVFSPKAKSAVVVHDLIPLWYAEKHPGYFGYLEQFVVNRGLAHSVHNADRVIAISHATAADITDRLGRSGGLAVVHNGVPISAPGDAPLEGSYIFAVTSNYPHKNASGVLAAYRRYRELVDDPVPLVVCGIDTPNEPGVIALKGLSDSAMHGCYANAKLFLFLSFIEGFGFPPVEAMSHGTSVLCSDIPSLREVTRGFATYVSPDDYSLAGERIAELLGEPESDRKGLSEAVAGYGWDVCATGVLNVLKELSGMDGAR